MTLETETLDTRLPGPLSPPTEHNKDDTLPPPQSYELYSMRAIAVAALLGGPVAGAILMAINFHCEREDRSAYWVLAGAALVTIAFFLAVFTFPSIALFSIVIGLPFLMLLTEGMAAVLQRDQVELHRKRGGRGASIGLAALIGIAAQTVNGILFIGAALLYGIVSVTSGV